jgi:hypothetical protein
LNDQYIDSGLNNHMGYSYLEYTVLISSNNGMIEFSYQVEAEEIYDYFQFLIDGREVFRKSNQLTWSVLKYPLSKGYRKLTWAYSKGIYFSIINRYFNIKGRRQSKNSIHKNFRF